MEKQAKQRKKTNIEKLRDQRDTSRDRRVPQPIGSPRPAADYLLVQRAQQSTRSPGGIELPNAETMPPLPYGLVIEVGDNCNRYPVNTYVLMKPFGGHVMSYNDTEWVFIKEEDIVGTLQQ